jgi:RNA polymerase sigma-70 factor (ECF subfamily)
MDSHTARPMLNDLAPLDEVRESGESAVDASAASGSPMFSRIRCQLNSDEELVAKLKTGEAEALTVLFERHNVLVFKIARSILRDEAEAEDAVQQVFLDLFRSVAKFDSSKGTFKVWLLMYAYHRALNHKRGLQAARFYVLEDLEEVLRDHSEVEKRRPYPFQATEAAHLVREALEQIQPRQREVIELVYYEGCTAEEIAARTGDTATVVRHNLYRGMEKARSILNQVTGRKAAASRNKVR